MSKTKANLPDIPSRIVRVDGITITGEGTSRSPLVASVGVSNVTASSVVFTPSGSLAATNVASALIELDTEKEVAGTTSTHSALTTGVHGAGVNTFVYSNDSRLTDSRNAADVSAWAKASTKPTYTYTEVGAEQSGSVSTHAALTTGVHGSGANSLIYSNDSRLTDARTPTAHNQAETTITFTDVTTGNVSSSAHGFCPKLPNNTTTFLRGDGTYASITGSGLTYLQTLSIVSLRI